MSDGVYQKTVQSVDAALRSAFTGCLKIFESDLVHNPAQVKGWTTLHILEHITLTNHFLLLLIKKFAKKALKRAASQEIAPGESDLQRIEKIANDRTLHWQSPEHMVPTGEKSIEEIKDALLEQQTICIELLDQLQHGEGSLAQINMSVANLGKLDLYQWLFFLTQHMKRHIEQIRVLTA